MNTFLKATLAAALVSTASQAPGNAEVTLVENGESRVAIHVAPEVMAADRAVSAKNTFVERETEMQRRRLRESVNDLALYLKKMSGAEVRVLQQPPTAGDKMPVLVGQYAQQKFGAPKKTSPFKQGYRYTVTPQAIGLQGENDESTSYAVYEVLDRLGIRWFMPGEIGEYVPQQKTIRLAETDLSDIPGTEYRGIWYADDAFKRRNRMGGFLISAGHALDGYITKEQFEAHPEWNAERNGQRQINSGFLCWGNPEVANAVADTILGKLDKAYTPSVSLSPKDGVNFCECEKYCKPLDAGDFDPTMGTVSITDRYVVFCNRIVEKVAQKYPGVQFGFLAYVQYTRPPVREKPHPNLVPQIAPITYCRAHAMTDEHICPSRPIIKPIVDGWGKVATRVSYYNYIYNLAEVSVPYPMMHQMSEELPILYKNNVQYWQPETLPNFDSAFPGMWLTIRMAWDNDLQPKQVLDELFSKFYGPAEQPMRRYWQIFDNAWTNVPEHAGSGWGHLRRFTPEVMKAARGAMDEALATASTPLEYRRVKLFDESLRQFERFMQLRWDLAEGRLADIEMRSTEWLGTQLGLGNEYAENYAFTKVGWTPRTVAGTYFKSFFEPAYLDAGRIANRRSPFLIVTKTPLREWKYAHLNDEGNKAGEAEPGKDGVQLGEARGWHQADFKDTDWKTTDIAVETWADLGLLSQYGTMWYRTAAKLPQLPEDKKVFLWMAATDGSAKLFVNGQHVPYINAKGETVPSASGYSEPFSFDITSAIKQNAENQITIAGTRLFINELGTGGLLGPVYLYREK